MLSSRPSALRETGSAGTESLLTIRHMVLGQSNQVGHKFVLGNSALLYSSDRFPALWSWVCSHDSGRAANGMAGEHRTALCDMHEDAREGKSSGGSVWC